MKNKYKILILILILMHATVRSIPYMTDGTQFYNGIPQDEDAIAEITGTAKLIKEGKFSPSFVHHEGYTPEKYAPNAPIYYPITQINLMDLKEMTGLEIQKFQGFFNYFLIILFPLLFFMIIWEKENRDKVGIYALLLAVLTPAYSRDLVWSTNHTILGMIYLLLSIFFLKMYYSSSKRNWLILLVLSIFSLIFIHLLTFFILATSLLVFVVLEYIIKNKELKYVSLIAILVIIGYFGAREFISFGGEKIQFSTYLFEFLYFYSDPNIIGKSYPDPIWTYISVWGYVVSFFAGYAILSFVWENSFDRIRLFFASLFLVIILVGNSRFVGIYFLNFRIIPLGGIPLVFFGAYGLDKISKYVTKMLPKVVFPLFITFIILSSTMHVICYQNSKNSTYPEKENLYPSEEYLDSFDWIRENTEESATVLVHYTPSKYLLKWMPLFTGRKVCFGWIIDDSEPTLSEWDYRNQKSIILRIISPFVSEGIIEKKHRAKVNEWLRIRNLSLMLSKPENETSRDLMEEYSIKYIYLENDDVLLQKFEVSTNFKRVYENNKVTIFEKNKGGEIY